MAERLTLAGLINKDYDALSPAVKRVARALIADYPAAGLESVHNLAKRANVSAPTVLRLLTKIGVSSYPEMQSLLREEISARTASPAEMYGLRDRVTSQSSQNETIVRAREVLVAGLDSTFASIPVGEFDEIVKLIANPKRRIWTVGGRFTGLLAEYLTLHLKLMRREVHTIGPSEFDRANVLIDFTQRDVLLAFDFRRYQPGTIDFMAQAKKKRVTTVLFTDPWLSPAAKHADHLLSSSVIAPSPFDSLTSGMALVETVIAGVVEELGVQPMERVKAFDEFLSPATEH